MTQAVTTTTPAATATKPKTVRKGQQFGYWWGTGRRKSAVARVRIKPGTGKFLINDRLMEEFFTEPQYRMSALAPLKAAQLEGKIDVFVKATGGGITGQAGAVLMGLSRALVNYDDNVEAALRENGYLTRDSREVERKKPGQAGARRRFQFSKR